jgi:nitronate monooxygenase
MHLFNTPFTAMFGLNLPVIGAPMFLVSNPELVSAVSNGGALGGIPSLNFKTSEAFDAGLQKIKKLTNRSFAVNLIVNQANPRQEIDLDICVKHRVPLIITSLGNPKHVIEKMHAIGSKVFCDVVNLEYAQKVQSLGADGVIAVSSGAGGHAGPISPLVLIPYLKKHLKVPVIAAGGIASGDQMLACLLLGASGVQIGTRLIATQESPVDMSYKTAILQANPEDIVLTKRISGTPASVINTDYVKKQGLELSWVESMLLHNKHTKKYMKMLISYLGSEKLTKAVEKPTWKSVWSAGQGVGLIDAILPINNVLENLRQEASDAYQNLMKSEIV